MRFHLDSLNFFINHSTFTLYTYLNIKLYTSVICETFILREANLGYFGLIKTTFDFYVG